MSNGIKLEERLYKFTTSCYRCLVCTKGYPEVVYEVVCPIYKRFRFFTYSLGGMVMLARALYENRMPVGESASEVFYKCVTCGACGEMCAQNDFPDSLWMQHELRARCVETGEVPLVNMAVIEGLKKDDNMLQKPKADRGKWAEGLGLRNITQEKAAVYFHVGCRYSYDEELWPALRAAASLLERAGVDFGIAGKDENCCGGRAYELGYHGEFTKYAENTMELMKSSGAKTIVTPCADGYYAFEVLYDMQGKKGDVEVYHITEYLVKLIKEGKLKPTKNVDLNVTYHDPCHLARKVDPWLRSKQNQIMPIHEKIKKGEMYQPPRDILAAIPGIKLIEMRRTKENAWCCGAGGGVIDAYPEFAEWTAQERLGEAKETGAEALVTACPWCKRNFLDTQKGAADMKIVDLIELLQQSV